MFVTIRCMSKKILQQIDAPDFPPVSSMLKFLFGPS